MILSRYLYDYCEINKLLAHCQKNTFKMDSISLSHMTQFLSVCLEVCTNLIGSFFL